jgi:perosamine synthetase
MQQRIPVAGPWITEKEVSYVADAAANDWYESAGRYVAKFESAFAAYLGVRHAVSLPSCTSAIHLALAALGVGPGNEVIVPESTWIATAAPISYCGATPVFVDIDPRSWCIDVESFRKAITSRTKAVIPVDLYGDMPNWSELLEVAREHKIAVIEDAAEAIGAKYRASRAGSLGDIGVFSFHGSKTLTTGEGGMLVTDDQRLFERALVLRDHGRSPGDRQFFNREVAFKYKMSSLQAAFGLAQLERVEELIARKREIFGWYRELLGSDGRFQLNDPAPDVFSSYWMVTALLPQSFAARRDDIRARLAEQGIDTRPFFHPLSSLPAYAGQGRGGREANPTSYAVAPRGINLPSALSLSHDDVRRVVDSLRQSVEPQRHA